MAGDEEITIVFSEPEPFQGPPPWWRRTPPEYPWVLTILYCACCGDELDRHYPSSGIGSVRSMAVCLENTFHRRQGCGVFLERNGGFRYKQIEVTPEEMGFTLCDGCGQIRKISVPDEEKPWKCVSCREIAEAVRLVLASPDGDWI